MATETPDTLDFDALNLVSSDMDATLAFYRLLGVDIPESSVWRTDTGAHHVEIVFPSGMQLDFDSVALAKHYNAGYQPAEGGSRGVIGFKLPSREAIDERYGKLIEGGYKGRQPPYDAFWGARYAIVEDPDGNHVGFMSPSDPDRRREPPSI